MSNPSISILLPVYNAERFLAQAVDSVLAQTFSDFELLILDDGSTDRSIAIIKSYTDPRIRLHENEQNMGISATLNKGIALATSSLIARMDADDICYPDRLQKQFNYLETHPSCALVASWVRLVSEEGEFIRQDDFKSAYYFYNLTFECWIYHPTILFRKEAVQAIGSYTVPYSEDFELFWQLSRRYAIHTLPEVLLDYRVSSQSLHQVQKKSEYELAQHAQVLRNLRYYAGENADIPASHVECLRHHFLPLLAQKNVREIVRCLQLLDTVTKQMLHTPNPNLVPEAVVEAASYKKNHILYFFLRQLPVLQKVELLLRTKAWGVATKLIKNRLKRMSLHQRLNRV